MPTSKKCWSPPLLKKSKTGRYGIHDLTLTCYIMPDRFRSHYRFEILGEMDGNWNMEIVILSRREVLGFSFSSSSFAALVL